MRLYSYWRSSSAWRVRIALAHKSVAHEVSPVHLVKDGGEQHTGDYRAINPMRQVPALVTGTGEVITQSMAIIEYLEEMWPEPSLLPGDALARARARELAEIVNAGIQPLQNLRALQKLRELGEDSKRWGHHWIERGLTVLEARAPDTGFLAGERVTVADVFLVPQLYNAGRFGIDVAAFPKLARIRDACLDLAAFRDSHPDRQPDAETGA